jgi:hypothetical protein
MFKTNWYKKAELKDKLYIHYPDGVHTWGICFESEDQNELQKFVYFCNVYLNEKLKAFWQSGSKQEKHQLPNFQFFEFLGSSDEDLILKECERTAYYMGLVLQ